MATEYISDYEPLTIEEITKLLRDAMEERCKPVPSYAKISMIQSRLNRGVVGSVTPVKIGGNVEDAENAIATLYIAFINGSGQSVDELAVQLYRLMQTV